MAGPNKRITSSARNNENNDESDALTRGKPPKPATFRPRRRRRPLCARKSFRAGILVIAVGLSFLVWLSIVSHSLSTVTKTNADASVSPIDNNGYESPLLIITCNRPDYLKKTLEHVLETIPQPCGFGCPVVVSEDGDHESNRELLVSLREQFEAKGIDLIHIHHPKSEENKESNSYVLLAQHFGWALTQLFDGGAYASLDDSHSREQQKQQEQQQEQEQQQLPQRVILLEEDIEVAPDFFSYMRSTSALLDHDPTLFAVSAFNDNGFLDNGDPTRLLRSDFFPGLGWMMSRTLWKNELESKWPDGYWDDWLRDPDQRKDRQVIRPEVSRTYHFGSKGGASSNQFGSKLERVRLNQVPIRWELHDLSYLNDSAFDRKYTELVAGSKLANTIEDANSLAVYGNVRMEYEDFSHFHDLARRLDIMADEKAAVPRTAYHGIVEVQMGSGILFLTPKGGFQGYRM